MIASPGEREKVWACSLISSEEKRGPKWMVKHFPGLINRLYPLGGVIPIGITLVAKPLFSTHFSRDSIPF